MKLAELLQLVWKMVRDRFLNPAPSAPTNLDWSITDMKKANILLKWKRSVSKDVVKQYIRVYINEDYIDTIISPKAQSFQIENLAEGDRIYVELSAFDGTYQSEKATLDFIIPDLSVPAPPTLLDWRISKVEDDGIPEY